jgi:hypothetical protein
MAASITRNQSPFNFLLNHGLTCYSHSQISELCQFFKTSLNSLYVMVGWGTMLQAGRSPVRVSDEIDFFNLPNPSSRTLALRSTQPLTEMCARKIILGVKSRRPVGLTTLTPYMSRISQNIGPSTSRNPKVLQGLYTDNFTLCSGDETATWFSLFTSRLTSLLASIKVSMFSLWHLCYHAVDPHHQHRFEADVSHLISVPQDEYVGR